MSVYVLPGFCRVCLKHDKNLIDLEHIENEPNETLMSKLHYLVSEVEWSLFKPMLCHPCIRKLNLAYAFKKQCAQSGSMLTSYITLVQNSKKKESQESGQSDVGQGSTIMMLPNQKYIKIVVGPQNQNTFQNVFLNVVPTTTVSPVIPDDKSNKDTAQNVFLNINNTFQKFIPTIALNEQKDPKNNINQFLTDSKTEELSVEIDPTDLALGEGGNSDIDEDGENCINDWEDLISSSQIISKSNGSNLKPEVITKSSVYGNYVPILPKQTSDDNFSNSGQHFLSSQLYSAEYQCESCQRNFTSMKYLKKHIKEFHLGKFPFKCEYCYTDFILRTDYEACVKSHKFETDPLTASLTLNDFKNSSIPPEQVAKDSTTATPQELTDLICELCNRQFNSTSGLLRHKVRKHNQKSKKKYFIKGMKNAKCDICNREFSTQSYMQLHRKLHLRDDIGYKFKVFGKNRYIKNSDEQRDETQNHKKEENSESEDDGEQKSDNQTSNNAQSEDMDVEDMVIKEESLGNHEDDEEETVSEEN